MGLRHTTPLAFSPVTACDALDSTDLPTGAMQQLRNLVPDPSTINLWTCRPASILLYDFAANNFGSPWSSAFSSAFGPHVTSATGFISALKVIGNQAYGMIAYGTGVDIPFSINLLTNTAINITGVLPGSNCPTSPATTGAWTAPTMDVIGINIVVTHPGFNTINGYFGVIGINNPSAPSWGSGNTAPNALPAVPVGVKNFNGRAWYLVNPATGNPGSYYSDVLAAGTITSGSQVITYDDNIALTAMGALGVEQTQGGILQALIVFKGVSNVYQVTGDAASSTLAKNSLNIATGTFAVNSVTPTPKGLAFISPDGMRIINFAAQVSPPIGDAGKGITIPFINAVQPTRIAACFNADTFRASTQNGAVAQTPTQDWWLDFSREAWNGPHDFPSSLIQPYKGTFIMTPTGVFAKLFQSDVTPMGASTFIENGTQMTYTWQTAMLPDTDQMCENAIVETTLHMALSTSVPPVNVAALDQTQAVFDTVQVSATGSSTLWNAFNWDQAQWNLGLSVLFPRPINWHQPIVFRKLSIYASGQSDLPIQIGRLHLRYEQLGYIQQ